MKTITAESQHLDKVRELFREYQTWLDADVCFHGFEEELANLPGGYSQPNGAIYLIMDEDQAIACSAIKPSANNPNKHAELKRLYVKATYRGKGLGREIFQVSMRGAQAMGYEAVVLETLPEKMKTAQILYRAYGFQPVDNYLDNADQGVECFQFNFKNNA